MSYIPIKQIYGTWQLTKDNARRIQAVISSVDILRASVELYTESGTSYTICRGSLIALLISKDNLKALEGATVALYLDRYERVLQIESDGKAYIDFDKALNDQKTEDRFIFVLGAVLMFIGIAEIGVSYLLLRTCKKRKPHNLSNTAAQYIFIL